MIDDGASGTHSAHLRKGHGGLEGSSALKCEQITTLPKDYLRPSALGGALPGRTLEQVEVAVLRAIGVPIGK